MLMAVGFLVFFIQTSPARLPAARQGAARLPYHEAETRVRERLIGLGYREIVSIPHVSEERDALFRPASAVPARLANPLSEEADVLRSTGAVTMAAAIEWNVNHGQRNVRLFEIGRHYRFVDGKPMEMRVLTIGATGEARAQGLSDPARELAFADLKGDLDAIGELSGGIRWEQGGPEWLNGARRGRVLLGEGEIGAAGQLARRVAERFKFRQNVFLAELNVGPLYCMYYGVKNARRYEPLPRFPAVERDFSLFLKEGTSFQSVKAAIGGVGIAEIASVEAADLYRGENVPAGKFSLMLRVTFQNRGRTLTEAEITSFSSTIVGALEEKLGAQLRAG